MFSWAMFYLHFSVFNVVFHKEVPYVHVFCSFATGLLSIDEQVTRTDLILKDFSLIYLVALRLNKVVAPNNLCADVIDVYDFGGIATTAPLPKVIIPQVCPLQSG